MKTYIKKIITGICAASILTIMASTAVLASERRTQPGVPQNSAVSSVSEGEQSGSSAVSSVTDSTIDTNATPQPVEADDVVVNDTAANVTSQSAASEISHKKYLSKMGGFLWFLLSVIVNFILSCWIGNKFYQLSRKSAQSSAEIRALRKDIEEKFASTIKDISEPATEVVNSNESYARSDEGVAMPDRQPRVEITEDEREILRKWDRRAQRAAEDKYEEVEDNEEYYEERTDRSQSAYQPTRRSSGIVFEEDSEEEIPYEKEETKNNLPDQLKNAGAGISKAAKKAKGFLSNVFPLDEE